MEKLLHPLDPQSNVNKFTGYDSDKYILDDVTMTILTDESLTPGRPPCLTQKTVGKFLQPLTRELVEVPPRPTIDELPDAVIENMVQKDKAFWVDKPGSNAYTLHDAYYNYGMTTEMVKPNHQDVFPRSYQYDLDCIRYRRQHGCDSLKNITGDEFAKCAEIFGVNISIVDQSPREACTQCGTIENIIHVLTEYVQNETHHRELWSSNDLNVGLYNSFLSLPKSENKPLGAHCRDCRKFTKGLTPFQLAWAEDTGQKRWKYYPDLTATMSATEIRRLMDQVGRPFQNEACNWYYKNYPPVKYDCILRKFSK